MIDYANQSQRYGDFIETFTGKAFYPLDPRPEEIALEDIAHALSMICRFNGHAKFFYSVAQHSINVQKHLLLQGFGTKIQLAGLFHDASEAYLEDIVKPLKPFWKEYGKFEKQLENMIFEKFGISPNENTMELVKDADNDLLALEARTLMQCKNWNPIRVHHSIYIPILEATPREAEEGFLSIAKRLLNLSANG